jgi:hypothetical protein
VIFSLFKVPTVSKKKFIAGFACIALMNAASTLMIDLVPGQSSSVSACVREFIIHEFEEEEELICVAF